MAAVGSSSIIIPVHNAEKWLDECLDSVCHQDFTGSLELSVYIDGSTGVPEDLIFFYKHLELDGGLYRVDQDLLMYRYHPEAATFSVKEDTIWELRLEFLQRRVLHNWNKFTIWNAGKQGRKFYRSLAKENQAKVLAFCDVDEKKIEKGFYVYEVSEVQPRPRIPIVHFRDATPPYIICVKMDFRRI